MNTQALLKSMSAGSALKFKLLGILFLAISSGFIWMANDHVIAPPVLRILDGLYWVFSGHYFFHFVVF
jgi:hypothetical protein